MNNERKDMVIKALLKLIASKPKTTYSLSSSILQNTQNSDISQQQFSIWINYVSSILDITYEYTQLNCVLISKYSIFQIAAQTNITYQQRISQIENEIIELARRISMEL